MHIIYPFKVFLKQLKSAINRIIFKGSPLLSIIFLEN